MPHFEKAQIRGDIKGGTFYDLKDNALVQVSTVTGGSLSSFDILHRNVAESAFHNSKARFPPPKCHPDTRKAVIRSIMTWLSDGTKDDNIDDGEGDSGDEGSSREESHSGGNGNSEEDGDSGDDGDIEDDGDSGDDSDSGDDGDIEDDGDSEDDRDNGGEEDSGDEAYSGEDDDSGDDDYRREQKKPILWLHAPAGAGKSAIAQSVAERCCKATPPSLAASFFFSRNIAERNTDERLVATLAYQIGVSTPAVRPFIEDAVKRDPCIFARSMEDQFAHLIAQPLVQAAIDGPSALQWPTLILLDGLDECIGNMDGEQNQCAIIEAIYTTLTHFDIPLRFLIVSRPEPHIHNTFKWPHLLSVSHYLKLDDSFDPDQDIETFLLAEFARISAYHSYMVSVVDWPSKTAIWCLVKKSSQQFIYASTVVKFVGDWRHNPVQRLDMVLGPPTNAVPLPFTGLDTLYRQVLDSAQLENMEAILTIFSIVEYWRDVPPTLADIAGLMALSVEDVNLLLYE